MAKYKNGKFKPRPLSLSRVLAAYCIVVIEIYRITDYTLCNKMGNSLQV